MDFIHFIPQICACGKLVVEHTQTMRKKCESIQKSSKEKLGGYYLAINTSKNFGWATNAV